MVYYLFVEHRYFYRNYSIFNILQYSKRNRSINEIRLIDIRNKFFGLLMSTEIILPRRNFCAHICAPPCTICICLMNDFCSAAAWLHGCKCFNEDFFDYHAFIHTYIHTYTIIFLYRYIHIALTKWFIYVHTNTLEGRWWLPPQPPADWRLTVGQQTGTYLVAFTTTTRQITRKRRMSQKK